MTGTSSKGPATPVGVPKARNMPSQSMQCVINVSTNARCSSEARRAVPFNLPDTHTPEGRNCDFCIKMRERALSPSLPPPPSIPHPLPLSLFSHRGGGEGPLSLTTHARHIPTSSQK